MRGWGGERKGGLGFRGLWRMEMDLGMIEGGTAAGQELGIDECGSFE